MVYRLNQFIHRHFRYLIIICSIEGISVFIKAYMWILQYCHVWIRIRQLIYVHLILWFSCELEDYDSHAGLNNKSPVLKLQNAVSFYSGYFTVKFLLTFTRFLKHKNLKFSGKVSKLQNSLKNFSPPGEKNWL